MEELYELRKYIQSGQYDNALLLLDEMEEMSRDDKINKISSFMEILLIHLIKQAVEQKTTRSWEVSIRNSVRHIVKINKRRRAGGWYLTEAELSQAMQDAYVSALDSASLEIFEGQYTAEEIDASVDRTAVMDAALNMIRQQSRLH